MIVRAFKPGGLPSQAVAGVGRLGADCEGVTNQPGDVIEARFEFQTWLLAPCLGDIEDGTLMEVQPGGGKPATGLLPCETFPAQPEQPMRIPVGRVEWGFTTPSRLARTRTRRVHASTAPTTAGSKVRRLRRALMCSS